MHSSKRARGLSGLLAGVLVVAVTPLWSPSVVLGQVGGGQSSLVLAGNDGWAHVPHAAELNTTASWTIEAWFKDETPGGYTHGRTRIITKGDSSAQETPYFMDIWMGGLYVGRRVNWNYQILGYDLVANGVSHNTWHHAAASLDSATGQLALYLDGAPVAQSGSSTLVSPGNTDPVSIGRNGGSDINFWRGKLDDIRLWNVVRTPGQIASGFSTELTGSPAGLVGNWRFNEGGGPTSADNGGTPQDAILQGSGAAFDADTPFGVPLPRP
jgi:Concanavalin A-like lectin/glucanases superfamily